tara:strand:+ start:237 stop:632 length:396 start_codon:yes stop_codon:yes gene_type:complete
LPYNDELVSHSASAISNNGLAIPILSLLTPLIFSSTPHKRGLIELEIIVEIKLSFIRGVNEYCWEMIRVIEELRGKFWMYKEISEYLRSRGFVYRRGKPLSSQLVERMYKKYFKKIENEFIKSISIELIKS